jgi:hypothetical protein
MLIHEIAEDFNLHVIIWSPTDAFMRAIGNGTQITKEECYHAMRQLSKWHDCNLGTTWDTLDYVIEGLIKKR